MLTGEPPFGGTTPQRVLARQRDAAAPGLGDMGPIPETVAAAVSRALEKERSARFATAGDFAAALGGATVRPAAGAWLRRRLAAATTLASWPARRRSAGGGRTGLQPSRRPRSPRRRVDFET